MLMNLPYSGKLSREKTFAIWYKTRFRGENYHRLLRSNYYVGVTLAHAQHTCIHAMCALRISHNFAEKTFVNGSETMKKLQGFLPQKFSAKQFNT